MLYQDNDDIPMALIRYHDIHHIVNNLDTTSLGEGLIAAWELGSGCGPSWISWCLEPQALWWGILMAPRRTFAYFLLGKNSQNLFNLGLDIAGFNRRVGDMRDLLLPKQRSPISPEFNDYLRFFGCAILGLVMIVLFTPVFLFFTFLGIIVRAK